MSMVSNNIQSASYLSVFNISFPLSQSEYDNMPEISHVKEDFSQEKCLSKVVFLKEPFDLKMEVLGATRVLQSRLGKWI